MGSSRVSRAFFTEHADISKREVIVPIVDRFGISASDVETAWHERRFSPMVDAFIEDGHKVGVTGVPAMGWPNRRAIVGIDAADRARASTSERLRLS
jgi:predicted DsbA family dithiol-disulfide isomerase